MTTEIKIKKFVNLIFLIIIFTQFLFSAFDRLGIGARAKGMGEAFCAVSDDASSIYWNPAGLTSINKPSLFVSYEDLFNLGLIDYYYIGYVAPNIGDGNVAFGFLRLNPKLDFLNYSENTFIFSYARRFFKHKISFGCNVKYCVANYSEDQRGSTFGIDIGLKYKVKKYNLDLGLLLQDILTTNIRWSTGSKDEIEPNARIGLKYKFISFDIDNILKDKTFHIGCEQRVYNVLYLRTGAFSLPKDLWCYTIGFSIKFKKVIFDYGCKLHPDLGYNNIFNLGVLF